MVREIDKFRQRRGKVGAQKHGRISAENKRDRRIQQEQRRERAEKVRRFEDNAVFDDDSEEPDLATGK